MGLQCDPTVIYALERAGRYDGNLTRDDLQFDSPYNTYRYAGLPPGPIASPGRASLEAAVSPADVPYIYFVSKNDGSHAFATTLDEHNRNVQQYQVKYFRDSARSADLGSGLRFASSGARSPIRRFRVPGLRRTRRRLPAILATVRSESPEHLAIADEPIAASLNRLAHA